MSSLDKLPIIYIVVISLLFFLILTPYRHQILQGFNYGQLHNLYQNSQYNNGGQIMQDDQLYAYAGYSYVTGTMLDQINVEHPPFGKYLIGLSIIGTGNPVFLQIVVSLILLVVMYLISLKITQNHALSALAPILLVSQSLFINRAIISELDIMQITVTCLFLYTVICNKKRIPIVTLGILLGLVATIKFPTMAVLLVLSLLLYLLLIKDKGWFKKILHICTIALLIYLLTYLPLIFAKGPIAFLKTQERALRIHLSHVPSYPPFAATKVMLTNTWPIWWDEADPIRTVPEWSVYWPILFLVLITSPVYFYKLKKKNYALIIVLVFTWLYFIFINSRLFFPHYLLPILVMGSVITTWLVHKTMPLIKCRLFR